MPRVHNRDTDEIEGPEKPMAPGARISFIHTVLPILFLLFLIIFGLIIGPQFLDQDPFPLEVIFIFAAAFSVTELRYLGITWSEIDQSVVNKLASALPAFFILFAIGVLISSWMVAGTIPMLVYYGVAVINPTYLYLMAFVVPIIFSTLTGTSWGSVGTIGVVIIGIASALDAHLGITAGAVIGGAYFGDKMSPLSDTTNLAALAAGVDLFDHIRSMMLTTIPSAIIASVAFLALGFIYPPAVGSADMSTLNPFLDSIEELFRFNILLILPPVIVLYGSIRKRPTIPTLVASILIACALALIFQPYSLSNILESLNTGFNTGMAPWADTLPSETATLVNRGGLYSMSQAIFVAFLVFFFIGTIDTIDAMPTVVNRVFAFARSRSSTILAALASAAITNSLTSNQYATSFIVGDAFRSRFDRLRIPRKVLSRSLEDTGTMIESIVPWTSTAVFMVATLGVPWADYWHWQLLSLINFVIAPLLAITGIGCFYHEVDTPDSAASVVSTNTDDL
jgi:NhaC family Na+:H+ antiporter